MIYPTISLGGTSKSELVHQYGDVWDALDKARRVLIESGPHARDYYPQGSEIFNSAVRDHSARVIQVEQLMREIDSLRNYVLKY